MCCVLCVVVGLCVLLWLLCCAVLVGVVSVCVFRKKKKRCPVCTSNTLPCVPFKRLCVMSSFLGVQFFRMPRVHSKNPRTSCDIHPCSGESSFIPCDRCDCSIFLVSFAPRLLSIATKIPPDVCLRSSRLAFSSLILGALGTNLHACMASLLN